MFKWLADMIVKTPVQGTCSCCEGKKEQLKKMQKAILDGGESGHCDFEAAKSCCAEGGCHCGHGDGECHCGGGHKCSCKHQDEGEEKAPVISLGASFSSASYSASYHFDKTAGGYQRSVKYHFAHPAEDNEEHSGRGDEH